MKNTERYIEIFSIRLALIISLLIALVAPLSYYLISYQYLRGVIDAQTELCSLNVTGIVKSNPVMWHFESLRLSEILEQTTSDNIPESRKIYDVKDELVAWSNVIVPTPLITRSSLIYDAGTITAHVEVSRSLRPLLKKSALVAVFSFVFASLVFNLSRTLPVKSLKKAYRSLGESEEKYRTLYESLQMEEDRYQTLFNQGGEGIIIMSHEGKIVDANESFSRTHGYSKHEIIGKNISDFDQHGGFKETPERSKSISAGETLTFEVEHYHKDGHVFQLEVSASQIYYHGESYFLSFHRDISERKRAEGERHNLEAQLQQAQKMESVGRLAGGVAHDFNNLLTVISGYSELGLLHSVPGQPTHEFFILINKASEKSADLTRQLLTFARKQTIAPKVLDLNETVTGIFKMLQRLIGEDIHIIWQPSPHLPPVKVDPSQIDQILANLCVNARDAITNGNGKITIETSICLIDETYCEQHQDALPGEYVRLVVSDNGCGMDKKTLAQIFEPFFTTKELGKGTGLGLASVYGIVKQNNGFLNVYSEPGIGTTFTIYLPRHDGENSQTEELAESTPRGHETLLLVEDELDILNMTAMLLEKQGYKVIKANTPEEATALARAYSSEIHLLITDVVMPEMNGRELADRLMSHYPHLNCLFMSGYTAEIISHHGVLTEGINFIQKPFSLHDLATKIRVVLDSK